MNANPIQLALATLCIAGFTAVANAGITTSLPGFVEEDTVDSVFEARGRVDGWQTQTWKNALWGKSGSRPVTQGAIRRDYFNDEQTYSWSFSYDATSGEVNWSIEGLEDLSATFNLTDDNDLVGFKVYARADEATTGGSTVVDNMQVTYNGQTLEVADQIAGDGNAKWTDTEWYFTEETDSFVLTGDVTFDWVNIKKTKTERYKFGINAIEGYSTAPGGGVTPAVPSPAAIWAGITLIGYSVMRRSRKNKAEAA